MNEILGAGTKVVTILEDDADAFTIDDLVGVGDAEHETALITVLARFGLTIEDGCEDEDGVGIDTEAAR